MHTHIHTVYFCVVMLMLQRIDLSTTIEMEREREIGGWIKWKNKSASQNVESNRKLIEDAVGEPMLSI